MARATAGRATRSSERLTCTYVHATTRQLGRYACMTDTLTAPRGAHPADLQDSQHVTAVTDVTAPARPGWKRRLVRFGALGVVVAGLAVASAVLPMREIADTVAALGPIAAVAMA